MLAHAHGPALCIEYNEYLQGEEVGTAVYVHIMNSCLHRATCWNDREQSDTIRAEIFYPGFTYDCPLWGAPIRKDSVASLQCSL